MLLTMGCAWDVTLAVNCNHTKMLGGAIISVISICMKAGFILLFLVNDCSRLFFFFHFLLKNAVPVIGREGHLDNGSVKV